MLPWLVQERQREAQKNMFSICDLSNMLRRIPVPGYSRYSEMFISQEHNQSHFLKGQFGTPLYIQQLSYKQATSMYLTGQTKRSPSHLLSKRKSFLLPNVFPAQAQGAWNSTARPSLCLGPSLTLLPSDMAGLLVGTMFSVPSIWAWMHSGESSALEQKRADS